ncbi:restriction endonuclease subunit S, partial [Escherichia coli]
MKNKSLKPGWRWVKFGDVVRLPKTKSKDPLADGFERYVGLEHLEPGDLRIRS